MKRLFINNLLWMATVMLLFASCMEKKDLYQGEEEPGENGTTLKPESAYFDFNLTRQVTVELDYGTWGGGSLFGIYTENPVEREATENETRVYRADAPVAATVFADKQGKYTGTIEVPACTETLYVVTTSPWLTEMVEAPIVNGRATVKSGNYEWTNSRTATRLAAQPIVQITTGNYPNLYSIVGDTWNEYGKTGDPNGIIGQGNMTVENMQQIYHTLLHLDNEVAIGDFAKYTSEKMSATLNNVNNSNLLIDTEHINCSIAKTFVDDEGVTQTVSSARLGLTFISEAAAYMSTLGYYYYKTDACPESPADVKKYMVFPNASIPSGTPFGVKNWRYNKAFGAENAPVPSNTRVLLLYEDENGQVTPNFPPGYTIGFFLISNSMGEDKSGTSQISGANKLYEKRDVLYSNEKWNTKANKAGTFGRYIALEASDGRLVYGLEDAQNNINCTDLLFYIDCDPSAAIVDPDRPKIEDEPTPTTYVENTVTKNYAFEDQWPTGGDYDLNDVIVKHDRVITKASDNLVVKITDRFTPVQPVGSANYRNAIAITGSSTIFGAVTSTSNGVMAESETDSYILTTNANSSRGQTIEVVREFASGISETAAEAADWETYIISQYDPNADTRTEVHLPKHKATSKHNSELNGTADDAYYIDKTNMYPFSIEIPGNYKPAPESTRIDTAYPQYVDWVKSNGSGNKDWYDHPSF